MKSYSSYLHEKNIARSSKISKDTTDADYRNIEKSLDKLNDTQVEALLWAAGADIGEVQSLKKAGKNTYTFSVFDSWGEHTKDVKVQFKRVADRIDVILDGKRQNYIDLEDLVGGF